LRDTIIEKGNLVKLKSGEKGGNARLLIVRAIMVVDEKQVEAVVTDRKGHGSIDFRSAGLDMLVKHESPNVTEEEMKKCDAGWKMFMEVQLSKATAFSEVDKLKAAGSIVNKRGRIISPPSPFIPDNFNEEKEGKVFCRRLKNPSGVNQYSYKESLKDKRIVELKKELNDANELIQSRNLDASPFTPPRSSPFSLEGLNNLNSELQVAEYGRKVMETRDPTQILGYLYVQQAQDRQNDRLDRQHERVHAIDLVKAARLSPNM